MSIHKIILILTLLLVLGKGQDETPQEIYDTNEEDYEPDAIPEGPSDEKYKVEENFHELSEELDSPEKEENPSEMRYSHKEQEEIKTEEKEKTQLSDSTTKLQKISDDLMDCSCKCKMKEGVPIRASCAEIKKDYPESGSGYYTLLVNGRLVRKFCFMGTLCGSNGGWTRLVSFNARMEKKCPNELAMFETNGIKHCGRKPAKAKSCDTVPVPSDGINYSKVCGKVIGYQYYSTDGYRDGVSVTQGPSQKLVWSFIAGFSENHHHCPCSKKGHHPPKDIGDHYFCESGFKDYSYPNKNFERFEVIDPLWDGKQCNNKEVKCCKREGNRKYLPWFLRETGLSSNNLGVRICCDESTQNENVSVGSYIIYVQ